MTRERAAQIQYRRHSFYTVWLTGPNGEREQIGYTTRKSGRSLMDILWRPRVQERVKQIPGIAEATFTKNAERLSFSNGWGMEFGGTILQETE